MTAHVNSAAFTHVVRCARGRIKLIHSSGLVGESTRHSLLSLETMREHATGGHDRKVDWAEPFVSGCVCDCMHAAL
jgi:hypothetical protein